MARTVIPISKVSTVSDVDEYIIAVRAADSMAKTWKSDVAILSNLSVVKLEEADGTILEVVRWDL
jgi:hypothetical protein